MMTSVCTALHNLPLPLPILSYYPPRLLNLIWGIYRAALNITGVLLWLRLTLSKEPNRVAILSFRNAVFSSVIEHRRYIRSRNPVLLRKERKESRNFMDKATRALLISWEHSLLSFHPSCFISWFSVCAGSETLSVVVMNVTIFWDIAPTSPYVNWRFGGTYHLHLQGRKLAER
jgi:hypothetical protein